MRTGRRRRYLASASFSPRRSVRRATIGDDDDGESGRGVADGTVGKEDRWMLGLLGFFGGGMLGRDARQDAAYAAH